MLVSLQGLPAVQRLQRAMLSWEGALDSLQGDDAATRLKCLHQLQARLCTHFRCAGSCPASYCVNLKNTHRSMWRRTHCSVSRQASWRGRWPPFSAAHIPRCCTLPTCFSHDATAWPGVRLGLGRVWCAGRESPHTLGADPSCYMHAAALSPARPAGEPARAAAAAHAAAVQPRPGTYPPGRFHARSGARALSVSACASQCQP